MALYVKEDGGNAAKGNSGDSAKSQRGRKKMSL